MTLPRAADSASHIRAAITAALAAAAPGPALLTAMRSERAFIEGTEVGLIAVGKAAAGMARAWFEAEEGLRLRTSFGVVIVPQAGASMHLPAGVSLLTASHPEPTAASQAAGEFALEVARRCDRERIPLVVLLSGGASSLMCVPEPGLTIADLAAVTRAMSHAGAPIADLNTVRQHCDRAKGGGLARAAGSSPVHAFILSDVIGNPLDLIGSGPTAECRTTPEDAIACLERYKLLKRFKSLAAHLRLRTSAPITSEMPIARNVIVADNAVAVSAACGALTQLGFVVADPLRGVFGEARDRAFEFVAAARTVRARAGETPAALVWGGETTVTVKGHGRGGRNLEAALAAAIMLDGESSMTVATFATDGVDGSTDSAGAMVDGRTAAMARRGGRDPELHLAANNSMAFFADGLELFKPGPTGTNVNDLWIALAY